MATTRGHRRGRTYLDVLALLCCCLAVGAGAIAPIVAARERANRLQCVRNLRLIGEGLAVYANDFRQLPRTAYDSANDAPLNYFTGQRGTEAADPKGPAVNDVTAALFLLVRYAGLTAPTFRCSTREWQSEEVRAQERYLHTEIASLQRQLNELRMARGEQPVAVTPIPSFPAQPPAKRPPLWPIRQMVNFPAPEDLQYSITNPYPPQASIRMLYKWSMNVPAAFVIAADINPGTLEMLELTGISPPVELRKGNSPNHGGEGQNVLFIDGHVEWATTPFVGANRDNIYTRAKAATDQFNRQLQTNPPSSESGTAPALEMDSVLLPTIHQKSTSKEQ